VSSNNDEQLKRAYVALDKLKQRLTEQEGKAHEPIALVGIGCRFPGGVNSPEDFWRLLSRGEDGIVEVPGERWDNAQFYSAEPGEAGKMTMREAGFIDKPGYFDADFFGISPREARSMDPQQRLLLEVCWEALENANIVPESLRGGDTGVFLGIGQNDYGLLQLYGDDYRRINSYDGSGNGFCFASGRLSYVFGWHGPCLSVDSACSSSLLALHLACQSLRNGESKTAVVAGVQLMLTPNVALFLSKVGALAADGRSKSFDAAADGYGRGEGCGAVVLKRLSDAQRDGDQVVALIRGSAVNHDGPGSGLTVPNGAAQQQLITQALRNARIKPHQVNFVEAHGTGTVLGDPIEAEALGGAYSEGRSIDKPLYIGSVKTNVGHLEAAAGIISLIKAALALKHRQIPANVGFKTPNPYIPWQRFNLKVPTALTDWQASGEKRYAGVSSFGMSGTNAHVILEQAEQGAATADAVKPEPYILAVSAKTPEALEAQCRNYAEALEGLSDRQTADFCYTANTCRTHFARRLAVHAPDRVGLIDRLRAAGPLTAYNGASEWKKPKIALLFTGQGSQRPAMGRELYDSEAVFRDAIDQCEALSTGQLPVSIKALLCAELDDATLLTHAQPAIFALQYALSALWESRGVQADFVLGHSIGEYAAACRAGVFSLADGLRLVCARSRCINALALPGGMAAVIADAASVQKLIAAYAGQVSIAGDNGPNSCVISGVSPVLDAAIAMLEQAGLTTMALNVAHAFHSPAMEPVLQEFAKIAATVDYQKPQIPMISTLTGLAVDDEIACADYWVRQIRSPVLFYPAIRQLFAAGAEIMLEIGAKPVLSGLGKQIDNEINSGAAKRWLPSLAGKAHSRVEIAQAVVDLYMAGIDVDLRAVSGGGKKMALPTYPWQREYYWLETSAKNNAASSSVLQALANGDADGLLARLSQYRLLDAAGQRQALELLQDLTALHQNELRQHKLPSFSYRIDWQPTILTGEPVSGCRLLIADQQGRAASLAKHWRDRGDAVILIEPGERYENLGGLCYRLRLGHDEDWLRCFSDIPAERLNSVHTGVHFGFCDLTMAEGLDAACDTLAGVVTVCRVLQQQGRPIPLWLVTENAQAVQPDDAVSGWLGASAWGLGRVLALELPEYFAGLVDIGDMEAGAIADIVAVAPKGMQIAVRPQGLYQARLVPSPSAPRQTMPVSPQRDYLVSGGLGGLGLVVANWLAANKARRVWLVSRRPANDAALQAIEQLRQQGCDIRCVQADISDSRDVTALVEQIAGQGGVLKGVIHAAGVLNDGRLENQDAAAFNAVLAAKVQGAWLLHEATASLDLDFFVLFSSAAAVLGSVGQAAYASANAAMDALAHHRRGLGLPALTINWGAWAGAGMFASLNEQARRRMQANGVAPIPVETACRLLDYALVDTMPQRVMIDIDWAVFNPAFSGAASASFWAASSSPVLTVAPPVPEKVGVAEHIAGLNNEDAYRFVTAQIAEVVKQVLYIPENKALDNYQGFFDMGLDSITVAELRIGLQRQLGCPLPQTLLFDYPNIHEVGTYWLQQYAGLQDSEDGNVVGATVPIDAVTIQQYSEQELDRLISEKLEML